MASYPTPEFHLVFEEYCEAIYELSEDDVAVIQARIAERLEVSRPAVSEMIHKMESEGLVALDSGSISLTVAGAELAERVVRRHRIAERFLTDVLGLSWTVAHHEAGKWEHIISPVVEEAMIALLGQPTTCPHGNPIPGSTYQPPTTTANLSDIPVGGHFTVTRITEELEFQPGLLDFLESSSIKPGFCGTVTSASPDGAITVEIEGDHVGVGAFVSDRILVTAD